MALSNGVQHFQTFPLKVFFNSLNVTHINVWTLHKDITGNKNSRQNFIVILAYEHRQNYVMPNRSTTVPERDAHSSSSKRRQCQVIKCRKNKTKHTSILCQKKLFVVLVLIKLKKRYYCINRIPEEQ